jgi:hypothetical protein
MTRHSKRRACWGSRREARVAGIQTARRATRLNITGTTNLVPYEQRLIAKDHQDPLGAVEKLGRPGIEDRAGWCSDPLRTAQYGAVTIRYSALVSPHVHFPGFFGRASA